MAKKVLQKLADAIGVVKEEVELLGLEAPQRNSDPDQTSHLKPLNRKSLNRAAGQSLPLIALKSLPPALDPGIAAAIEAMPGHHHIEPVNTPSPLVLNSKTAARAGLNRLNTYTAVQDKKVPNCLTVTITPANPPKPALKRTFCS